MAYNVVVAFLSWQLILPHLTVVQASTHWVVTEDGRIQAQVIAIVMSFSPGKFGVKIRIGPPAYRLGGVSVNSSTLYL